MTVQLQSRWRTTLAVGGKTFQFYTFSGGSVTAEAVTSAPPGVEYARASAGEKQIAAITIGRDYDSDTDDAGFAHIGKYLRIEDAATIQRQRLDKDRNPAGSKHTWVGVLTANNEPDSDSNTTSDKSSWTVEMQPSSYTVS